MKQSILNQPAFVLHRRPFKESSFFLEILTQDHGRLSLLAKGARRARSKFRGRLELFIPLSLSWQGNPNHLILTQAECPLNPKNQHLIGKALLCGFYLNELLIRLLRRHFPLPALFESYQETLSIISKTQQYEIVLRLFEKKLLKYLGYELPLPLQLDPKEYYVFEANQGARLPTHDEKQGGGSRLFSGASLLALANGCFDDPAHLKEAKMLMQLVFAEHFGMQHLKTRELFL